MRGRPRKNDIPSSEDENVLTMYFQGASLENLAKMYDVTPYVVKQLLLDYDVDIRPQGRPRQEEAREANRIFNELTAPLGGNNGS